MRTLCRAPNRAGSFPPTLKIQRYTLNVERSSPPTAIILPRQLRHPLARHQLARSGRLIKPPRPAANITRPPCSRAIAALPNPSTVSSGLNFRYVPIFPTRAANSTFAAGVAAGWCGLITVGKIASASRLTTSAVGKSFVVPMRSPATFAPALDPP